MKERWQRFRAWAHDWWGSENTPMSIEEYWDRVSNGQEEDPSDSKDSEDE